MKIFTSLFLLFCLVLATPALAQGGEGAVVIPVTPVTTMTGLPHFLSFTWTPDNGDPFSVTGTLDVGGATPGANGLMIASLAGTDQAAFGFLPVLVDVDPMNVNAYYLFGYDAAGSITAPGVSRSIPALVGYQMHIQCFEFSPLVTSSNGLIFEIAP